MPKYICKESCYHRIAPGRRSEFYKKGELYPFKNDQEAGPHFERVKTPKEVAAEKREAE